MKAIKHLAIAATLLAASAANAGLISVVGGNDYAIASNNDILKAPNTTATTYNIGGNIYLNGTGEVSYTYLGYEAGYTNVLKVDGANRLNNKTSAIGATYTTTDSGLLDFRFYSKTIGQGVSNGANNPFMSPQSFAVILDVVFNGVFYDALIAFDDSGAGPDDNHDDMIVGIRAKVPEPTTLALMGLGLVGFTLRRKQA